MINFRSKITRQVLPYLLLNPEAQLYLNEIVVKFGVDRGNLVKKLSRWEADNILIKQKRGNLSLYRVNVKNPLYKEWRAITEKQFGLENALRSVLKQVAGVKQAYIFGSYARNTMGVESDIDILLIGSHRAVEVERLLRPIQKRFDREINIVDMTEREFIKRKKLGEPFIKNILTGKNIKLYD